MSHRRTVRCGVTPCAAYSCSFLGFVITHLFGDFQKGKQMAEYANSMLIKCDFKRTEPKTLFMIYANLRVWTQSYHQVLPAFLEIYEKGMSVGDCLTALLAIFYYLELALYAGRDLQEIDKDLVSCTNQTVDYRQETPCHLCRILLQTV